MTKGQQRIVWQNWFSISLPADWISSEEEGVITLCNEEHGVGALQISLIRRSRPGEPNSSEAVDLSKSFIKSRGWSVDESSIQPLRLANSPAAKLTHLAEDEDGLNYWQVWHIVEKRRTVCITYNCEQKDADVEATTCATIISSFRWEN